MDPNPLSPLPLLQLASFSFIIACAVFAAKPCTFPNAVVSSALCNKGAIAVAAAIAISMTPVASYAYTTAASPNNNVSQPSHLPSPPPIDAIPASLPVTIGPPTPPPWSKAFSTDPNRVTFRKSCEETSIIIDILTVS
jgi:hypothetical protein